MNDLIVSKEQDFKIINVNRKALTTKTYMTILEHQVWIDTDCDLREHIFNVDFSKQELKKKQIKEIKEACDKRNAAYFRLIDL